MELNQVGLIGRLTRDPETRHTSGGSAVCTLGLAASEKYKDKSGEWLEKPMFVDVKVWGKNAENCQQYLTKGQEVTVTGKLEFESWQTDQGEKRSKHVIRAHNVSFGNKPKGQEGGQQTQPDYAQRADKRDNGQGPPSWDDKATTTAEPGTEDDLPF